MQCCLNTLGTILHSSRSYAVLSKRLQTTLHKIKFRQIRKCRLNNIWPLCLHMYISGPSRQKNINLCFLYHRNWLKLRLKQQFDGCLKLLKIGRIVLFIFFPFLNWFYLTQNLYLLLLLCLLQRCWYTFWFRKVLT